MPELAIKKLYEFQQELHRSYADRIRGLTSKNEFLVYQEYGDLFEPASLIAAHRHVAGSPSNLDRAYVRNLTHEYVNLLAKPIMASVAKELIATPVGIGTSNLGLAEAIRVAAAAPTRNDALNTVRSVDEAIASNIEPLYRALHDRITLFAQRIGYADQTSMYAACYGADLGALANECSRHIADTAAEYQDQLSSCADEYLGATPGGLHKMDAPRLWRRLERLPGLNRESVLRSIGASSGLAPEQALVKVVAVEASDFRSRCLPVSLPHEVYAFVNRSKGDENIFLSAHEVGHGVALLAQHPIRENDVARWQDSAVGEAVAALYERMAWWHAARTSREVARLDRLFALKRQYMIRVNTAKLLWQLQFSDCSEEAAAAGWGERLTKATQFDFTGSMPFYYLDFHCYAAVYLQGWMLQSQLESRLLAELGPDWPGHPRTGDLLRSWLGDGDPTTTALVSRRAGFARVDARELVKELQHARDHSSDCSAIGHGSPSS